MDWLRRRKHFGKAGTTLVELIVTFALIGIFMTAAASMLTSSLRLFTRMQSTSRAILVSDNLLDKITGEISAAKTFNSNSEQDGYYFWLEPGVEQSRWIVFQNRNASPIALFASESTATGKADTAAMGEGQLFLKYYKISGAEEYRDQEEIDWHYDSRIYMGYKISDLHFSIEDPEDHPDVVRVDMTLTHTKTGFTYESFRYARCYNFDKTRSMGYVGVRDRNAEEGFPTLADDFAITGGQSGGVTEPTVPENPEITADPELAQLVVEHRVIADCDSVYKGQLLKSEYYMKDATNYNPYWTYIQANILDTNSGGSEWLGFEFEYTYNHDTEERDYGTDHTKTINVKKGELIEVTFYYRPKDKVLYCNSAYNWDQKDQLLKRGETKSGIHGQEVDMPSPGTTVQYAAWDGAPLNTYHLVNDAGEAIDTQNIKRQIQYSYSNNGEDNLLGNPTNNFRFYYRLMNKTYTIRYQSAGVDLGESISGQGFAGQSIPIPEYEVEGYQRTEPEVTSFTVSGDEAETIFIVEYEPIVSGAPFRPAGANQTITSNKDDRLPETSDENIAKVFYAFFNEEDEWQEGEYDGIFIKDCHYAYRTFEVNKKKYAVIGWTDYRNLTSIGANVLDAQLPWGTSAVTISSDDDQYEISNETERENLFKYVLTAIGAPQNYISNVGASRNAYKNIKLNFDSDRHLTGVEYVRPDGATITITYQ